MTRKLAERMTNERFAALCERFTRKGIADELGITIHSVLHYERRWDLRPLAAHRMPTRERFTWLAERHTAPEIARLLSVGINSVRHWERAYDIKCRPAPRGRRPGQSIYLTTPYRPCYLVQGGVWDDLRQLGGSA